MAHDVSTGQPFALEDPNLELDPSHHTLHRVLEPELDFEPYNAAQSNF